MKKKLFIHIGTHKTGSTAIQRTLLAARRELRNEGIIYLPAPPPVYRSTPYIANLTGRDAEMVRDSQNWLLQETEKQSAEDKFLISYEGFSGSLRTGYRNSGIVAECLREMTGSFDVHIIAYLRRQDSFIEAAYTEMIHAGALSSTFPEFVISLGERPFDWQLFLSSYAKHFGKESITVRRYDKEFLPTDQSIIEDFAGVIGSECLKETELGYSPNRGYSRDALEIARLCGPYFDNNAEKRNLRSILQSTNSKQPFESYSFFDFDDRVNLLSKYSDSDAAVAKVYLKDSSDKLFSDPEVSDQPQGSYQGLTPGSVSIVIMRAIVGMQVQRIQEEPVSFRVVRKIEQGLTKLLNRAPAFKKMLVIIFRKLRLI